MKDDGYTFAELTSPKAFYDDEALHLIANYRSSYRALATYYINIAENCEKALSVLDRMENLMSHNKIKLGWEVAWELSNTYKSLDEIDMAKEIGKEIEPKCLSLIEKGEYDMSSYYNPFRALLDYYEITMEHKKRLNILNKLAILYPEDHGLKQRIKETKDLIKQLTKISK
jgi:hypothetical protein